MKILVVGGAGFIGSNLCVRLIDQGHEVVCADNFSRGNVNNLQSINENDRFTVVRTDAYDLADIERVFRTYGPEYVFHLAANSDIQASASNPEVEYRNTYSTTFNILSAMREYSVKKFFLH